MMIFKRIFGLCAATVTIFAQSGDKPGEVQAPPPETIVIPPAPPLSPEEALKSFKIAPGFKIEVAASDPMIEAPVEIEFDPEGRMFVLEMRGFMPNVEGKGEDQHIGRVSLLEDTKGDGRMDKSTVYADNLLMPRAIAFVRGGLLIAEPPHLWFFEDVNGDGRAEKKTEVSSDYGNQSNPEHNANGLLWARDNWIYSANHTVRYRNVNGTWEKDKTNFRGQWGISQDDYGRLFFNSNSDQFRGDLVPAHYLSRNPNFKTPFGANVQLAKDQQVWPARVNPGVNRGYQKGQLRPDGTLRTFTGACGPVIYRGELFPEDYYGAGFVCEPTGNFVRCNFLNEKDGIITATNAFPESEFLASTDERFRPVNLFNGPDGALYVVDMYRGVIQHRIYLTTFLRNQALDRGLDNPLNLGRIYRIVPENAKIQGQPKLASLSNPELVRALEHGNGWRRDTAQELLVEKQDQSVVPALTEVVKKGAFPAAVHALWVLDGMGQVTEEVVLAGLKSSEEKVRATSIRVGEYFLRDGSSKVAEAMLARRGDDSFDVKLQLMFSLGETKSAEAEQAMVVLLDENSGNSLMRSAAISGLANREIQFLEKLVPVWTGKSSARAEVVASLARSATESRNAEKVEALLNFAATQPGWEKSVLLQGMAAVIPPAGKNKTPQQVKPIRFASEPKGFAMLKLSSDSAVNEQLKKLDPLIVWPGKSGFEEQEVIALTAEEKNRFEAGKELYAVVCGACHQPNGLGLEGLAPPLVDADWVTGSPERLTRIVLHGMRGPITVKGKKWELDMPPLNILDDSQIAQLLTYVRREWGHTASPISPEFVGKVRKETEERVDAWTEADLLKVK